MPNANKPSDMWESVIKTDTCWVWMGGLMSKGYGQFTVQRKNWRVHRLAYTLTKGPIPAGLVIDHLCRNIICVNPDHLEAVTQKENTLRGLSSPAERAKQTHCAKGHELTPDNVYSPPQRPSERNCIECKRDKNRAHNKKRQSDPVYQAKHNAWRRARRLRLQAEQPTKEETTE